MYFPNSAYFTRPPTRRRGNATGKPARFYTRLRALRSFPPRDTPVPMRPHEYRPEPPPSAPDLHQARAYHAEAGREGARWARDRPPDHAREGAGVLAGRLGQRPRRRGGRLDGPGRGDRPGREDETDPRLDRRLAARAA